MLGLVLTSIILLQGCAGYRLGTMLPPDIKTVYAPTFINETGEPLVDSETTQAFIEELQLDGSLKLVEDPQLADAVLYVTVKRMRLEPLAYETERETLAREYRLTLTAKILFERRATKEVLFERPGVQGESTFVLSGDISNGKRLALPDAAEDLAHDIVEAIVESW